MYINLNKGLQHAPAAEAIDMNNSDLAVAFGRPSLAQIKNSARTVDINNGNLELNLATFQGGLQRLVDRTNTDIATIARFAGYGFSVPPITDIYTDPNNFVTGLSTLITEIRNFENEYTRITSIEMTNDIRGLSSRIQGLKAGVKFIFDTYLDDNNINRLTGRGNVELTSNGTTLDVNDVLRGIRTIKDLINDDSTGIKSTDPSLYNYLGNITGGSNDIQRPVFNNNFNGGGFNNLPGQQNNIVSTPQYMEQNPSQIMLDLAQHNPEQAIREIYRMQQTMNYILQQMMQSNNGFPSMDVQVGSPLPQFEPQQPQQKFQQPYQQQNNLPLSQRFRL